MATAPEDICDQLRRLTVSESDVEFLRDQNLGRGAYEVVFKARYRGSVGAYNDPVKRPSILELPVKIRSVEIKSVNCVYVSASYYVRVRGVCNVTVISYAWPVIPM